MSDIDGLLDFSFNVHHPPVNLMDGSALVFPDYRLLFVFGVCPVSFPEPRLYFVVLCKAVSCYVVHHAFFLLRGGLVYGMYQQRP